MSTQTFSVSSQDVMTSIVLPTIVFCIGMVVAMLVGINKCKQWELDKVVEMRRTRRVLQRVTNLLREKNFKTIQKARNMRKRAAKKQNTSGAFAPPLYASQLSQETPCGTSPPPSYEDALLDEYYRECLPRRRSTIVSDHKRRTSRTSTSSRHAASTSRKRSRSTARKNSTFNV
ncbi:unnamed protein product [Caenorhabditis auriculariae]|uniref:Uncharacterized protein n=1 Tax=Caenorhabditis auriculariae TaxID=2777116 RepID=A0A8S1GV53_9PELO|nr:unnamed protein product [Caenorhabditis auriculariae]